MYVESRNVSFEAGIFIYTFLLIAGLCTFVLIFLTHMRSKSEYLLTQNENTKIPKPFFFTQHAKRRCVYVFSMHRLSVRPWKTLTLDFSRRL